MKHISILIFMSLFSLQATSQTGIQVERNAADGTDRMLLTTTNLNDGHLADNEFRIRTGTGTNMVTSWILNYAKSYTGVLDYAGYLTLSNDTKGLIFRGENSNSDMRFLLGGFPIQDHQKMILTSVGNLGVGAYDPASRVQIKGGDVYLEDVGSGVIMKSPDGSCWRLTVTDLGDPDFEKLAKCPGIVPAKSTD